MKSQEDAGPEFTSEKSKLPKGYGYPLKSSFLQRALSEGGVPFSVHHIQRHPGGSIGVEFWPPNPNVHYERLYITADGVAAADVPRAREALESHIIPDLVAWAQRLASLPVNSPERREKQHFGRNFFKID